MSNRTTTAHRYRPTALMAVGAALLAAFGTAVSPSAAAPVEVGPPPVTYSATSIQSATLPSRFGAPAESDGWALALSTSQVFNVTHHVPTLEVTCHNQSDSSPCWPQTPTKVVTNGSFRYSMPVGAGDYLDQASGHLYTFAVQTNGDPARNQAGVVCVDTTKPASASGQSLFCGFTPLTMPGDAPIVNGSVFYASLTAPVQVGTNWYSFNEAAGVGAAGGLGTENTLMCFSLTTFQACPTANAIVPLSGTVQGLFGTAPPIGSSGSDILIPVNSSGPAVQMGCFDTATGAGCAGTWPVTLSALAGSPFPLLGTAGTPMGVCVPVAGDPCFDFTGATVATPGSLASVIGQNRTSNGPAVVLGASVYVADQSTDTVKCFDYMTSSSCANFPKGFTNLTGLYTVNQDPIQPNCLWVSSGGGADYIQNFDATSAGPCGGPIRLLARSVMGASPVCHPQPGQGVMYQSLQLTSPPRSSYASGYVQIADSAGVLEPIPALPVNEFGVVDLTGIDFSGDPLPEFILTFDSPLRAPQSVSLRLTWKAGFKKSCISGGQSVSSVPGYWMVASDGGIFNYGNAGFYGSTGNLALNRPVVGIATEPNRSGYWLVASDGGIFAFGDAAFFGSTGSISLNRPIVGMAATPDGGGYWLVASDGGIFAFGDAAFYGSTGSISLNRPVVGMAATPDGGGYWLVASDGGIFAFGDAAFYGSTGSISLNRPIVGMAADPDGGGYWMVASDGGIFAYGASEFYGSTGNITLNKPMVGMATTFDGNGYWLVASDGGIFAYGDAPFGGSAGNLTLNRPIQGMAS